MGRLLGGAAKLEVVGAAEDGDCALLRWRDRTAQLSSRSHLDPLQNLQRLCGPLSEEWQSFGQSVGTERGSPNPTALPILFQFLDAVHQIMYLCPAAFEFNELLLIG